LDVGGFDGVEVVGDEVREVGGESEGI